MAYFWFMFGMFAFICVPLFFLVAAVLTIAYVTVSDWIKRKVKR